MSDKKDRRFWKMVEWEAEAIYYLAAAALIIFAALVATALILGTR